MTTDYEQFVNRTSRNTGAVGTAPVCYRWAHRLTGPGIWVCGRLAQGRREWRIRLIFQLDPDKARVLDFGCGKGARHSLLLKASGVANVHPWDIGRNSFGFGKPAGKYNLVILSNVLNVQPNAYDVPRVLKEAWSYVDKLGFMIVNYPKAPRHNWVSDSRMRELIHETTSTWYKLDKYTYLLQRPLEDFH